VRFSVGGATDSCLQGDVRYQNTLSLTIVELVVVTSKAPVPIKHSESDQAAKPARALPAEADNAQDKADVRSSSTAPNAPVVSQTTDAATLAAIDTSGYVLPSVKVPGRRGRKPKEFTPENDEVAAL